MIKKREYTVQGAVTSERDGRGLPNLKVEAWDKDLVIDDLLGAANTDSNGGFTLDFDETHYREICIDRKPDVYFKVFFEGDLIKSTEDSVLWNVEAREMTITIPVSIERSREQYVVKGKVKDKVNNPAAGLLVRAMRRDLRKETPLGDGLTSERGEYHISFVVSGVDENGLDLMFHVLDREGKPLHRTEVHHNVPQKAEIDIQTPAVFPGFSEFERMFRTLRPLLEKGLAFADLEQDEAHDDIRFLSGKTGVEASGIARFVIAHKLAKLGLQPEFWFALLGGSFYQYNENQNLDERFAAILDALPSLDATAVRKALARGFNLREIPETFHEKIAEWVEAFLKFIASRLVSGGDKPTFVKLALQHSGIEDAHRQETFARLYNEYKALTPELLDALEKDDAFEKAEIADLSASFRLADLTRGDFSVVKVIKEEFGVREPDNVRTLAKKSKGEWVSLVKKKHAAGEISLPMNVGELPGQIKFPEAETYGKTLERRFREAFPTTAFGGGLERALRNDGARGLRHAEALGGFLDAHRGFELLNTPVDDFLANGVHPGFEHLARDEDFRLEFKAVQRVFKLAPTFEATDALLTDDIHSARQAYLMGESQFVRRYADRAGFTAETARLAWNRAADAHAAVLTVIGDLNEFVAGILPGVLKSATRPWKTFPIGTIYSRWATGASVNIAVRC